jgi:hypothetical protein
MKRFTIGVATFALILTACAADDAGDAGDSTPSTTTSSQPEEATTIPPQVPDPIDPIVPTQGGQVQSGEVPAVILDAVLADAADRTAVDVDESDVALAEFVVWSDGSLGCPEPGVVYTQALVEGYRVVIDVDGTIIDYRLNSSGAFRVCERGLTTPSGLGSGTPSPTPINPES